MKKKLLAIFLAAIMVMSLLPTVAFATETKHPSSGHGDWDAINDLDDLKSLFETGGSGYLTADVITADAALTIEADVDLCLNDKVLNLNGHNITVNSGKTFNLYDCGETVRYYTRDDNDKSDTYGLWTLAADQTEETDYTTTGGVITGGTGAEVIDGSYTYKFGGGVYVNGGTLNLHGGNIAGNIADEGGAVEIASDGEFTMTDGNIVGNISKYEAGGVYINEDCDFTMHNGSIVNNYADSDAGGVYILGGSFKMRGGKISDNTSAQDGGGVLICWGAFIMTSGSITGNKSTDAYGGGVVNWDIMEMTGGSITGNIACSADGDDCEGGGIINDGTLTLGGTAVVKNNYAEASDGTLYPNDIEFDGDDIAISSTSTPKPGMYVGLYGNEGDKVTGASNGQEKYFFANKADQYVDYVSDGTKLVLTSIPEPENNHKITVVSGEGGVVYPSAQYAKAYDDITLEVVANAGYQLKSLTAADEDGGTVTVTEEKFQMPNKAVTVTAEFAVEHPETDHGDWTKITDLAGLKALFAKGGSGYLASDITLTGTGSLIVAKNKTVDLCLNDKVLNLGEKNIIVGSTAVLNLYDCGETVHNGYIDGSTHLWTADALDEHAGQTDEYDITGGIITGGKGYDILGTGRYICGGGVYVDSGSFTMNGGTICGNAVDRDGGGVYVENDGSFTMNGGTICGNAVDADGGGVYVDSGSFTMNDGIIERNYSVWDGGGVANCGTFTMYNGKVIGNSSIDEHWGDGGGVVNWGYFTMLGGEISGNICSEDECGGGVANWGEDFTLGGTAVIKDNYVEKSDGTKYSCDVVDGEIELVSGEDAPKNGMYVGLYGDDIEVTNASEDDVNYFFANEAGKYVKFDDKDDEDTSNDVIILAKLSYTVTFSGAEISEQTIDYGGKVEKPADPSKEDYTFGGWYSDEACKQAWNFEQDTVTSNITLYAKWIQNEVQKAAISGNVTENDVGVAGATVELYLGTVKVAATVTKDSPAGNYSFDNVENGIYNIVVTKGDGSKTKTEMVTVNTTGTFMKNVVLPVSEINSKVEHKGNDVPNAKSDISQTVVGGLDAIAEKHTPEDGDKVTIKLTVEPKADTNTEEQQAIKEEAGDVKKVEFLDLSLLMQTNNEEPVDIGGANDTILTIVIPFDFTNVDVTSVKIIRYHGDVTSTLGDASHKNEYGEYVQVNETAGNITLCVMKFSDYAVAFDTLTEEEEDDGECVRTEAVKLTENGTYGMKLNCKDVGKFTFTKNGSGWNIQNSDGKYLTMKDGKLAYSATADTAWTYKNGAFSTTVKTTQKTSGHWILFIYIPGSTKTVTTTYYLSTVAEGHNLSNCLTCAELYTTVSGAHDFGNCWIDCKDGEHHKRVCKNCGEVETEAHSYDNGTHKCICGAFDPAKADVKISVDVKEKTSKQYVGFLFWGTWKNVTTYTATIKTEATGVKVTKVQYQLNGSSKWITGTCVSSDKPIETLKVKVTDNKGNTYEYEYPEAPAPTGYTLTIRVGYGKVIHDGVEQESYTINNVTTFTIGGDGNRVVTVNGETYYTASVFSGNWYITDVGPAVIGENTLTGDATLNGVPNN